MPQGFRVAVLASGSRGNATLIQTEQQKILVDLGISTRELEKRLQAVGVAAGDLDGVLITHEHHDHIRGLETFCKKFQVPVYTSLKTMLAIYCALPRLNREHFRQLEGCLQLGDVRVQGFATCHDAADPHGYMFYTKDAKLTYATDLGFVSPTVRPALEDCDYLILESNHDVDLLKTGPYPWRTKQRILSTLGHLSNMTAGETLAGLQKLPQRVVLAHLSQTNNLPELALNTVCGCLDRVGRRTELRVASQNDIVVL